MSFYVSDSLKNIVTEEDLLSDKSIEEKKPNFSKKFYVEIMSDGQSVYCQIESLSIEYDKTLLTLEMPESSSAFKNVLTTSKWEKVLIKVSNDDPSKMDFTVKELGISPFNIKFDIKDVRKSLLGYNYLVTIVIHDRLSF